MNSQRIAVVGAKGYIGRNLTNSLLVGGYEVTRITSLDKEKILKADFWKNSNFESVVWLASQVNPQIAQERPEVASQEREYFRTICENISKSESRLVFTSSGGTVYTDIDLPYNESSEAKGSNAYGRHKLDLENIILKNSRRFTILRLSNAYGRDQVLKNGQGVIAGWLEASFQKKPQIIYGSTSLIRDFIYIDDVTSSIEQVVNKQLGNEVFNIGSGEGTSLKHLLSVISEVTNQSTEFIMHESRGFDKPEVWLDISKAEKLLNWKPVINLSDGIAKTWHAMNSTGAR